MIHFYIRYNVYYQPIAEHNVSVCSVCQYELCYCWKLVGNNEWSTIRRTLNSDQGMKWLWLLAGLARWVELVTHFCKANTETWVRIHLEAFYCMSFFQLSSLCSSVLKAKKKPNNYVFSKLLLGINHNVFFGSNVWHAWLQYVAPNLFFKTRKSSATNTKRQFEENVDWHMANAKMKLCDILGWKYICSSCIQTHQQ